MPAIGKQHSRGSPRHRLVAHGPHLAGCLGSVVFPPVDPRTGLLHHHPRHVLVERADQVVMHGAEHRPFGVARVYVIVGRDDIELRGPLEIVKRLEKAHEIGRNRDPRAGPFQDLALEPELVQEGIVAEPPVIELLAGVYKRRRHPRRQHLGEGPVALAPKGGPPRLVERVHGLVAPLQPGPEGLGVVVAVAVGDVAGVLVVDVPHFDGRMVTHLGHQPLDYAPGVVQVDRVAHAKVLPAAGAVARTCSASTGRISG